MVDGITQLMDMRLLSSGVVKDREAKCCMGMQGRDWRQAEAGLDGKLLVTSAAQTSYRDQPRRAMRRGPMPRGRTQLRAYPMGRRRGQSRGGCHCSAPDGEAAWGKPGATALSRSCQKPLETMTESPVYTSCWEVGGRDLRLLGAICPPPPRPVSFLLRLQVPY